MDATDFVYNQIYTGALAAGASQVSADKAATLGVEVFQKNRFENTSQMIENFIGWATHQDNRYV